MDTLTVFINRDILSVVGSALKIHSLVGLVISFFVAAQVNLPLSFTLIHRRSFIRDLFRPSVSALFTCSHRRKLEE